jgi:hypothetical protein
VPRQRTVTECEAWWQRPAAATRRRLPTAAARRIVGSAPQHWVAPDAAQRRLRGSSGNGRAAPVNPLVGPPRTSTPASAQVVANCVSPGTAHEADRRRRQASSVAHSAGWRRAGGQPQTSSRALGSAAVARIGAAAPPVHRAWVVPRFGSPGRAIGREAAQSWGDGESRVCGPAACSGSHIGAPTATCESSVAWRPVLAAAARFGAVVADRIGRMWAFGLRPGLGGPTSDCTGRRAAEFGWWISG